MRRQVVAVFETEEALLSAIRAVRTEGHRIENAYTPYPVHGLEDALGLRSSRIPYVGLAMGILGLVIGVALQVWTSAFSWPLDVGGKPRNSLPAFVPVAFELVILLSGVGAVAAFFLRGGRSGLRPAVAERVADDRFALVVGEGRVPYLLEGLDRRLRAEHGAVEAFDRLTDTRAPR